MQIDFYKYQALLNDYIIVDRINQPDLPIFSKNQIKFMCNRREGIGADGILELTFDSSQKTYQMKIINSDASTAKMCGNGLRCMVKYLYDTNRITENKSIDIITDAGLKSGKVLTTKSQISLVSANLGQTEILQTDMYLEGLNFTMVDVGNPHIVTFVKPEDDITSLALSKGSKLEKSVKGGVNVGFAKVLENNFIELAVWERGAGFTMACGTGASAVVSAANYFKLINSSRSVRVGQSGGDLEIITSDDFNITIKGSASFVFKGNIFFN